MFLKNYWYVAAWSHEIEQRPQGRFLLNEPVVFFRKQDGTAVALEDRCPHRGFPLHSGRLIEDRLECGYHGITFDAAGRCVKVPGQSHVPSGADVQHYALIERWGLVWIWMGDVAEADPALLPDWTFLDHPDWYARGEYLNVNCNYQLIIDNLMDLSHLTFVHPHTLGSAAKLEEIQVKNEITDRAVINSRWLIDIAPPPTYARGNFPGNVDRWQISHFQPPGFVSLNAGAAATGTGAPQGNFGSAVGVRTYNATTPETAKTTHYYWAIAQHRTPQDAQLTDGIFRDIQRSIQEDIAVFDTHQRALDMKPDAPLVAIKSDAAPLAARRIIERLIHAEEQERRLRRA